MHVNTLTYENKTLTRKIPDEDEFLSKNKRELEGYIVRGI